MPIVDALCPYHQKPCAEVYADSHGMHDLFFAYASAPQRRVDAIRGALARLKDPDTPDIDAVDWADLEIEGTIIFCSICDAIRRAKCVVADLSGLNFNVLFELGFAIGSGTRVWPIVEQSTGDAHTYARFETLTTLGYSTYKNSKQIVNKLSRKKPWLKASHLPAPTAICGAPTREATKVLYLKSIAEDEASLRVTELVQNLPIQVITDDPTEILFQPLSWYVNRIGESFAVLMDIGNKDQQDARLHMAKCALVAGIALASGRRLLMLADDLDLKPIDYRDLLKNYKNAADAARLAADFLNPVKSTARVASERRRGDIVQNRNEERLIGRVELGDNIAELERASLQEYFVKTPHVDEALRGGFRIFVGRKGTGKTALAYMTGDRLRELPDQVVCFLNPKGYELKQLVALVGEFPSHQREGFVESLWKYMLSTEALRNIAEDILTRPMDIPITPEEESIRAFVDTNPELMTLSFSSRLVQLLKQHALMPTKESTMPEAAVIAKLNASEIRSLEQLIFSYLGKSSRELTILVDGLVAPWTVPDERDLLSDVLLGLIYAAQDLRREWTYRASRDGDPREFAFLLFLRTDVFQTMLERAAEPDKVQGTVIFWEDADALLDIINRRIETSLGPDDADTLNWDQILEPGFTPENMRQLLENSVLFRPRDVIYYFQRAFFHANRRYSEFLTRRDFDDASREYSEYALQALSAEWHAYIPNMDDLLLAFWGGQPDLSYGDVCNALESAEVAKHHVDEVIKFLIQSQFLGLAIDDHNYRFALNPSLSRSMERQAGRFVHQRGGERKFRIHRAFHQSLSLTEATRRKYAAKQNRSAA